MSIQLDSVNTESYNVYTCECGEVYTDICLFSDHLRTVHEYVIVENEDEDQELTFEEEHKEEEHKEETVIEEIVLDQEGVDRKDNVFIDEADLLRTDTEAVLRQYLSQTHDISENYRLQKCEKCLIIFTNKTSFETHCLNFHKYYKSALLKQGDYECHVCNEKFEILGDLLTHQLDHPGAMPYQCEVCCRRFSVKNQLQRHIRLHTGEKPYRCNYCPEAFVDRVSLTVHEKVHTGNDKNYECQYCAKKFAKGCHLSVHIYYKHPLMPVSNLVDYFEDEI